MKRLQTFLTASLVAVSIFSSTVYAAAPVFDVSIETARFAANITIMERLTAEKVAYAIQLLGGYTAFLEKNDELVAYRLGLTGYVDPATNVTKSYISADSRAFCKSQIEGAWFTNAIANPLNALLPKVMPDMAWNNNVHKKIISLVKKTLKVIFNDQIAVDSTLGTVIDTAFADKVKTPRQTRDEQAERDRAAAEQAAQAERERQARIAAAAAERDRLAQERAASAQAELDRQAEERAERDRQAQVEADARVAAEAAERHRQAAAAERARRDAEQAAAAVAIQSVARGREVRRRQARLERLANRARRARNARRDAEAGRLVIRGGAEGGLAQGAMDRELVRQRDARLALVATTGSAEQAAHVRLVGIQDFINGWMRDGRGDLPEAELNRLLEALRVVHDAIRGAREARSDAQHAEALLLGDAAGTVVRGADGDVLRLGDAAGTVEAAMSSLVGDSGSRVEDTTRTVDFLAQKFFTTYIVHNELISTNDSGRSVLNVNLTDMLGTLEVGLGAFIANHRANLNVLSNHNLTALFNKIFALMKTFVIDKTDLVTTPADAGKWKASQDRMNTILESAIANYKAPVVTGASKWKVRAIQATVLIGAAAWYFREPITAYVNSWFGSDS